ncbi:hypothetical protein DPMN_118117 [Dreissena polymorpha]|uniref:Uncharacterized protein n=1 Tax=Dreissena polymorpha TaxID=45954 RepID=A0A9D4GJK9_DREPO|nr:hypothetical protein DPMN_118117 [Dreissena polymorpha]
MMKGKDKTSPMEEPTIRPACKKSEVGSKHERRRQYEPDGRTKHKARPGEK